MDFLFRVPKKKEGKDDVAFVQNIISFVIVLDSCEFCPFLPIFVRYKNKCCFGKRHLAPSRKVQSSSSSSFCSVIYLLTLHCFDNNQRGRHFGKGKKGFSFSSLSAPPKNQEGKAVGEIEGGKRQRFLMWFWKSDTVSYAGGNNTRVPEKNPDKRTESEDDIQPVDAASTAALLLQGQAAPAECVGNTHFCAYTGTSTWEEDWEQVLRTVSTPAGEQRKCVLPRMRQFCLFKVTKSQIFFVSVVLIRG